MKVKRKIICAIMVMVSILSLVGCETSTGANGDEATNAEARLAQELKQNDYRGGVVRTQALQANIIKVLDTMKSNNVSLREDSPNSFWSAEMYQDFVATFLDIPIINDTCWFNEEEASWESTLTQMGSQDNNFTEKNNDTYQLAATVVRNEKDDYSVSGVQGTFYLDSTNKKPYTGDRTYRILYDCDKDWCKAYALQFVDAEIPDVTAELFEYMRIDENTFAIQTSRERLMIVLKPAESDMDIRKREIKEFYYSKLIKDGMRTTFTPYEPLPEVDEAFGTVLDDNIKKNEFMAQFEGINEKGDLSIYYGQNDSVFFNSPNEITSENFVFKDKSLQQSICYKDGVLVVTSYNKLSAIYERFTYSLKGDGSETQKELNKQIAAELESMVEINNLVGVQDVSETETVVTEKDNEEDTEEIESDEEESVTESAAASSESSSNISKDTESNPNNTSSDAESESSKIASTASKGS